MTLHTSPKVEVTSVSDETPAGPGEPADESAATPSDEPPTESAGPTPDEAPTEAITPPEETAVAAAPPAAAAAAPPRERGRGVFVPVWIAIVVGALLVAGLGFAIGWAAAPDDDSNPSNAVAGQEIPSGQSPGNDDSARSGNRDDDRNLPGSDDEDNGEGQDDRELPILRGAFLGVQVEAAPDSGGATIASVAEGSPAADAGLQEGDVITAVDDEDVNSPLDLVRQIRSHDADDTVTITYTRNGTSADAKVTLEPRAIPQSVG